MLFVVLERKKCITKNQKKIFVFVRCCFLIKDKVDRTVTAITITTAAAAATANNTTTSITATTTSNKY